MVGCCSRPGRGYLPTCAHVGVSCWGRERALAFSGGFICVSITVTYLHTCAYFSFVESVLGHAAPQDGGTQVQAGNRTCAHVSLLQLQTHFGLQAIISVTKIRTVAYLRACAYVWYPCRQVPARQRPTERNARQPAHSVGKAPGQPPVPTE